MSGRTAQHELRPQKINPEPAALRLEPERLGRYMGLDSSRSHMPHKTDVSKVHLGQNDVLQLWCLLASLSMPVLGVFLWGSGGLALFCFGRAAGPRDRNPDAEFKACAHVRQLRGSMDPRRSPWDLHESSNSLTSSSSREVRMRVPELFSAYFSRGTLPRRITGHYWGT